jgi:hypothetical protein
VCGDNRGVTDPYHSLEPYHLSNETHGKHAFSAVLSPLKHP